MRMAVGSISSLRARRRRDEAKLDQSDLTLIRTSSETITSTKPSADEESATG
jgi:hypothetical protein